MPGQDRTGPMGQGPATGRGFGPCGAGFGFRRGCGRGFGWGAGRGFGGGFGFRRFWGQASQPVELSKEEQKKILEAEKEEVEQELKGINEKLKEFEL